MCNKIKIINNYFYDLLFQAQLEKLNKKSYQNLSANEYLNHLFQCYNNFERNGIIENPFRYFRKPIDFSTEKSLNKTFEDLVYSRAKNILDMKKPIRLYWSGGIDSTCALVSFMINDSRWHEKIQIIATNSSINQENPVFFNQYLHDKNVVIVDIEEIYKKYILDNSYINVFGLPGSVLCHQRDKTMYVSELRGFLKTNNISSDKNNQISINKFIDKLYSVSIENKKNIFRDYSRSKTNILKLFLNNDNIIEQIQQYINKSPVKINTLLDLHWFFRLTRWGKPLDVCARRSGNPHVLDNIIGFYDTDEFISYSILNKDKSNYEILKYEHKKIIFDYDKNKDYFFNKERIDSSSFAGAEPINFPILLSDTQGNVFMNDSRKISKQIFESLLNNG